MGNLLGKENRLINDNESLDSFAHLSRNNRNISFSKLLEEAGLNRAREGASQAAGRGTCGVCVVLFDYYARQKEEISVKKGDRLQVYHDDDDDLEGEQQQQQEWRFVELLDRDESGYIHKSFIALEDSIEAEDWYFSSISRRDAERMLLLAGNLDGTFLVRSSETVPEHLSLSLKFKRTILHFRIQIILCSKSITRGYFLTKLRVFPSLQELVTYYSKDGTGLSCALKRACPKLLPSLIDVPPINLEKWKHNKKSLLLRKKLISRNFGNISAIPGENLCYQD